MALPSSICCAFVIKKMYPFLFRAFSTTLVENTSICFKNGITTITMCDKKTRNSLSLNMMQELITKIEENGEKSEVRAIILTAEGPVFSAGHNLKELSLDQGREQQKRVFSLAAKLMSTIIDSPVPIIARVDGLAAAAGCQLVAQCDLAFSSQKSAFSTPGANFGIFCSTPGVALARCIPKMTAMKMLLTGLPISSEEAVNCGLITKACPVEVLDAEIDAACDAIKSKSKAIIALGKKFYYQQISNDIKTAYNLGGDKMVENLNLEDGQEGIKSFMEKRKPLWKHQ